MTYCAGWKYADSVYLFADTAVTKPSSPTTSHSSFGQLHAEVRGEHVEESLLKLVPIARGTAVAFAGDVYLASQIVEFLKARLTPAENIEELFPTLTSNLGPFDPGRRVDLLLASSTPDGERSLIHWDTLHGVDSEVSDYYQIGSLTSYHSAMTPQVLAHLVNGNLAADRVLSVMTAIVQSYGVHDNLVEMNVGGIIFGLRCHQGEISWQEDTNFFLYDPQLATAAYISALVREDVLVVNSSLTNDTRVLAHSVSTRSAHAWLQKWDLAVKRHLKSDRFRYWVFIGTTARVITVIRREDLDEPNRYLSLSAMGNGHFDIGLSPELVSKLKQPLEDRGDGSLRFRLNFLNG
jgi:hypothetical protein